MKLVIQPKNKPNPRKIYYTRSGKKISGLKNSSTGFWLKGKINGIEETWHDTGNYIGSNYPHDLDIIW